MSLESGTFLNDLVGANPGGGDGKSEGDNHIRLVKAVLKNTFPGLAGRSWRSQTKSMGYTVVETDNMSALNCTAAFTLALTAAATLGNGHMFIVHANGGDITVDPSGAEVINGGATITISNGAIAAVLCNGTSFIAFIVPSILTAFSLTLLDDATSQAARATLQIAGKMAIPVSVTAMQPRSTNGSAPLAMTNGAADQPDVPYLAFDSVAKEYAGFIMQMPKGWNEGTITAKFCWRRASGVAGANVVWGIRAVAVDDDESPAVAFGAIATVTDAASTVAAANMMLSGETGACTIGGVPSESDLVFFEVCRVADDAADTLEGVDAWLTEITLFITTDETNDA